MSKMGATVCADAQVHRRRFAQEKRRTTAGVSAPVEQKCFARRKRRQRCCHRRDGDSGGTAAYIAARPPGASRADVRTYSSTVASERT